MKLNRRSFLGLIGFAPAAVLAAKLPIPEQVQNSGKFYCEFSTSYIGTGAAQSIPHSLGLAPRAFMLIKKKEGWQTYDNAEAYLKSMKEYLK